MERNKPLIITLASAKVVMVSPEGMELVGLTSRNPLQENNEMLARAIVNKVIFFMISNN